MIAQNEKTTMGWFALWQLMRMDKPIGILLLLWPTFWGVILAAEGRPSLRIVLIFLVGVIVTRAAGCVVNDIADSDFDGHVKRTKQRPLPQKAISKRAAWGLFVGLMIVALGLALLLNPLAMKLAWVGAALLMIYPCTKRFFHCPQLVLGFAFSWGIPMAYAAQTGHLPYEAWWLWSISVLWALVYDSQYAMVDRDDDELLGLYSSALLFGRHDRMIIGLLQVAIVVLWAVLAINKNLGWPFWLGLAAAASLFIWQQILIKERQRDGCFQAFLNNHWVGMVLFLGLVASYWF